MNSVQEQYNRYPYPKAKLFGRVNPIGALHASYETGSALNHFEIESHVGKSIALLGCGTMEPSVFAGLHPKAQITAVDLSGRSLRLARIRVGLQNPFKIFGHAHLKFIEGDLVEFCKSHKSEFDYIHSFGVLHHLENPKEGFKALASALKPNGFARIMVYAKGNRQNLLELKETLKLIGVQGQREKDIKKAKEFLETLPLSHPLRLAAILNQDTSFKNGFVDAILHSCEHPFESLELKKTLEECGLHLNAWDFSKATWEMLTDDNYWPQIERLEAFNQWFGAFTFWVSKKASQAPSKTKIIPNPLLEDTRPGTLLPSTILRSALLWPNNHEGLNLDFQRARFALRVKDEG